MANWPCYRSIGVLADRTRYDRRSLTPNLFVRGCKVGQPELRNAMLVYCYWLCSAFVANSFMAQAAVLREVKQCQRRNEIARDDKGGSEEVAAYSTKGGEEMTYSYLMKLGRGTCHTLTYDKPAKFEVDSKEVVITFESRNKLPIPREMVEKAISELKRKRMLTASEVHDGITNRHGARTDRLMAVLRMFPDVTYDKKPRVLYYNPSCS